MRMLLDAKSPHDVVDSTRRLAVVAIPGAGGAHVSLGGRRLEDNWTDAAPPGTAIALPLEARGQRLGTLTIWTNTGVPLDATECRWAEVLSVLASFALGALRQVEQLTQALESRDVIGQAKGIFMATHGVDADEAFERLRKESQTRNMKVRDLAERIAYTGVMPDALPPTA
jgi:hypothetical protein